MREVVLRQARIAPRASRPRPLQLHRVTTACGAGDLLHRLFAHAHHRSHRGLRARRAASRALISCSTIRLASLACRARRRAKYSSGSSSSSSAAAAMAAAENLSTTGFLHTGCSLSGALVLVHHDARGWRRARGWRAARLERRFVRDATRSRRRRSGPWVVATGAGAAAGAVPAAEPIV